MCTSRVTTQLSFLSNQLVLLEVFVVVSYACHDVEHLRSDEMGPGHGRLRGQVRAKLSKYV